MAKSVKPGLFYRTQLLIVADANAYLVLMEEGKYGF
jgi:hypothetical protein